MVVAVSARNKLIWSVTSQQLRQHWDILHFYLHAAVFDLKQWDFGLGWEWSFRCRGCRRFCPVETATIDHVVPRSQIRVEYLDPSSSRDTGFSGNTFYMKEEGELSVIPLDMTRRADRLHYRIRKSYGGDIVECFHLSDYESIHPGKSVVEYSWTVGDFVENLLENLQPMCAYCNSCKGNRW